MGVTHLTPRQLEELESDRARRRSQKFIAYDTLFERFGQAEWQRFRRDSPVAFYRAKFDVQGGPRGLWSDVEWAGDRQEVRLWLEWPLIGGVGRFHWTVLLDGLPNGFLEWAMKDGALLFSQECGVETKIQVRGDRAAWDWHEDHKFDDRPGRPRALPQLRREAGQICGTCTARFRTEELAALGYADGFNDALPCGHMPMGVFEEEVRTR